MTLIWDITLRQSINGEYLVTIRGEGGRSKGRGRTAYDAYRHAAMQLAIKPNCEWLQ